MKITSNLKGQIAMCKCEIRALELGYIISKPTFNARYDLILDDNKSLRRIQVKYADGKMSHSNGSVRVKLEYKDRRNNSFTYKNNEVDGLIVYIPKIDGLCYFSNNIFVGKKYLCIRINSPKNGQLKGILNAKDYLI